MTPNVRAAAYDLRTPRPNWAKFRYPVQANGTSFNVWTDRALSASEQRAMLAPAPAAKRPVAEPPSSLRAPHVQEPPSSLRAPKIAEPPSSLRDPAKRTYASPTGRVYTRREEPVLPPAPRGETPDGRHWRVLRATQQ